MSIALSTAASLLDGGGPGLGVVALVVVVIIVFGVAAFAYGYVNAGLGGGGPERQRERSSGWSGYTDAKRAGLVVPERSAYDRLTLGWMGARPIAAPTRASVALFAPTLSGKTTKFVVHRVLEWQGAMVSTSAKADLVRLTMRARADAGPVWVFDPLGMLAGVGIESCHWSPLQGIRTYADALKAASWIASTSNVEGGESSNQRFWDQNAKTMLAPLLFAAAQTPSDVAGQPSHEQHVRQVRRWLQEGADADPQIRNVLTLAGDVDARDALSGISTMHEQTRKNIAATALVVLDPFAHPRTHDALQPTGNRVKDFDPARLLDEGGTLYVFAPEHEAKEYKTLFETIINTVVFAAQDRSAAAGGLPIAPHHLLLALDEAANMASLRSLPELASVGSSQGIVLMTVWQNMSQPETIYGTNRSRTLLAGHNAKVFWGGIHDDATLKYVEAMCGQFEYSKISTTRDRDRHSRSTSSELRPLASADYVRKLSRDRVLVVLQNAKPLRLSVKPWYGDAAARERVDPAVAAEFDDAFAQSSGRSRRGPWVRA